jgi:cyclopropane fatty-acyl-phospholipid synthase-like methyltransferase
MGRKSAADNPAVDPKEIVRTGYDLCAKAYAAARREDDTDQLKPLLELLPADSTVLDLGCGAGIPIARRLAARHRVTGVDVSKRMLRLARAAVPEARFVHGDISEVELNGSPYDAAVAIYVLFHLPRETHGRIFRRVWSWLRPGGYFLATLTEHAEEPYTEDDFFGARMYWSNLGWPDYEVLLRKVGFDILGERMIGHGYGRTYRGRDERHPMVLAQKPE